MLFKGVPAKAAAAAVRKGLPRPAGRRRLPLLLLLLLLLLLSGMSVRCPLLLAAGNGKARFGGGSSKCLRKRQSASAFISAFMDRGEIVESGSPKRMFEGPQTDRLKLFLSQILRGH